MALVSRWKFDNNVIDTQGAYNGTAFNMAYSSSTRVEGNYSGIFNSSSPSYVTIDGVNPVAYTNYSFSVWIMCATAGNKSILHFAQSDSTDDRHSLHAADGLTKATYYVNKSGAAVLNIESSIVCIDNTWHFITVTDANGTVNMYVDAQYAASGSYSRVTNNCDWSTIGNLRCQGHNPHASYRFNGNMDDIRFYDVALTATEVRQLYNSYFTEKATSIMGIMG